MLSMGTLHCLSSQIAFLLILINTESSQASSDVSKEGAPQNKGTSLAFAPTPEPGCS